MLTFFFFNPNDAARRGRLYYQLVFGHRGRDVDVLSAQEVAVDALIGHPAISGFSAGLAFVHQTGFMRVIRKIMFQIFSRLTR